MSIQAFFRDFLGFHQWAGGKVFSLADGLSQEALNASMPLGPGSLQATLVHLYGAQRIWLDRWQGKPTAGLPTGEGWSLADLRSRQREVDDELETFIESRTDAALNELVTYENLRRDKFSHRLSDLMLHVFNHGVHHRAQSLHFLKHQGRLIAGGLDYIFYKIANPTLTLDSEVAAGCRNYGLEVGNETAPYSSTSLDLIRRYQAYGDWAYRRVLQQAIVLNDEQLDHDWSMGHGSLRRTLLHLYDAECWWQKNWQGEKFLFHAARARRRFAIYNSPGRKRPMSEAAWWIASGKPKWPMKLFATSAAVRFAFTFRNR